MKALGKPRKTEQIMNKNAARKKYEKLLAETMLPDGSPDADVKKAITALFGSTAQFLPKSLYRYRRCCDQDFDALWNDKIYFNTPNNFNDPYDCLIHINKKRIEELLQSLKEYDFVEDLKRLRNSSHIIIESFWLNSQGPNKEYYDWVKSLSDDEFNALLADAAQIDYKNTFKSAVQIIDELYAVLERYYRERIYIACFSERVDSILMWSHYADYHRGFTLEYSGNDLFCLQPCKNCKTICEDEYNLNIYPVIYGNKRIDATEQLVELWSHHIHSVHLKKELQFISPDQLFPIKLNTTKAPFWKYEKEWRLIRSAKKLTDSRKSTACHPTAMYLGSKISPINRKILTNFAKEKGINIFEMYERSDCHEYKLAYRKLHI